MPSTQAIDGGVLQQGSRRPFISADLAAGITNGILSLPQGMAFAVVAGVPPQHGLYAMIVPTIVAALIRSSPVLITGATNTSALVIGALIATLPAARQLGPVQLMLSITLLMGIVQVASGVLRFGSIARYVSRAVLLGFSFGAGLLIVTGQLKNVLGVSLPRSVLFSDEIAALLPAAGSANARALAVAALTLGVVAGCAKVSRLIPGALLGIALSAVLVHMLGWYEGSGALAVLDSLPRALPALDVPPLSFGLVRDIMGPSLALALLGMVEAISIGKTLSARVRVRFYPDQELLAKGAGNVAGAFFGCMPSSASWTRSAVNVQMGARTRWAGAIAGLTVLAVMLLLAPWARFVPLASLSAVIIWIALQMFDMRAARNIIRWSRKDAAVMLITFAAILLIEIQYAIYLGIVASLVLLIHSSGKLHMVEMVETGPRQFREIEIDAQTGRSAIVLLQLEGDLLFGVVDQLEERLDQIAAGGARAIVIRMKRTHEIDATATEALAGFAEDFRLLGGRVILCGLKPEMLERIQHSNLQAVLGAENLIPTHERAFGSVSQAIELATRQLGARAAAPDARPLLRPAPASMQDAWNYDI